MMKEKLPLGVGMIQQWLRNNDPGPFIDLLISSGVSFVEIYLSLERWEQRAQWLDLLQQKGLHFTFHGPYLGDYDLALFEDRDDNKVRKLFHDTFERAAAQVRKGGSFSRVNLHGAGSESSPKPFLIKKTIEFLHWVAREKEKCQWPFDFVLELLPVSATKPKAGDCVPELLQVKREAGDGIAGFCWDMGHHRANEMLGFDASLGEGFLRQVRHAHIHDMKDHNTDIDHCPLNYGAVDYGGYLEMVRGHDLFMVLELNYNNTSLCGDPTTELLGSIRKLREARERML
jgi:sugar phosphate isomerase/epimerase